MPHYPVPAIADIQCCVKLALNEDLGSGDISAALIDSEKQIKAHIICRQQAVLCGQLWVDEAFKQIDNTIIIDWHFQDSDRVDNNAKLCSISGNAKSIISGERTALNFLQLLSATATQTAHYVNAVSDTQAIILDTRKTIPGLRSAQKYAVLCGGGENHRLGLYDAFLIKENHISSIGNINQAIHHARQLYPDKLLEIEVENLHELKEALVAKPDRILLDNFSPVDLTSAVEITDKQIKLEASGNIMLENIQTIASSGVDYISIGAITKDIKAIDLSLLIE